MVVDFTCTLYQYTVQCHARFNRLTNQSYGSTNEDVMLKGVCHSFMPPALSHSDTMSVTAFYVVQAHDILPSRWIHTAVAMGTQTLNMVAVCIHLRVTTL